jgi:hypothetical protein
MSRSAVAPAEDRRAPRMTRPQTAAAQRRISGPMRPAAAHVEAGAPRPRIPARPPLRVVAGGAAIALRVAEAALEVSGSRTMDRLVRSRAWVVIVAFGLIGIVAMQVSMLKLNAGIGRAVETAATLERSNATLRADVSQLSSGERIEALAGARGFIMPEPADVTYLDAGGPASDGVRAARRMHAPDPASAGPAGSAIAAAGTPAITAPGAQDAPTATATAAATGPAAVTAATGAAGTAAAPPPAGAPAAAPPPATAVPPATAAGGGASAVAPAATAAAPGAAALP